MCCDSRCAMLLLCYSVCCAVWSFIFTFFFHPRCSKRFAVGSGPVGPVRDRSLAQLFFSSISRPFHFLGVTFMPPIKDPYLPVPFLPSNYRLLNSFLSDISTDHTSQTHVRLIDLSSLLMTWVLHTSQASEATRVSHHTQDPNHNQISTSSHYSVQITEIDCLFQV